MAFRAEVEELLYKLRRKKSLVVSRYGLPTTRVVIRRLKKLMKLPRKVHKRFNKLIKVGFVVYSVKKERHVIWWYMVPCKLMMMMMMRVRKEICINGLCVELNELTRDRLQLSLSIGGRFGVPP